MVEMRTILLALLAAVTLPACSLNPDIEGQSPPSIELEFLPGHWVHSREEEPQNSTVEVFRPIGFREFPPSWFRMQYIFEEGGTCQWYYLAPNDGHHFRPGSWRVLENDILEIEQGDDTVHYRILELQEDVLRVVRIDSAEG